MGRFFYSPKRLMRLAPAWRVTEMGPRMQASSRPDRFDDAQRALGRYDAGSASILPPRNISANSFFVRSRPPTMSNLDIEELPPTRGVVGRDDIVQAREPYPFSFMEERQFARIFTHCPSFQSWRTYFIMYASPPFGTRLEKVPGLRPAAFGDTLRCNVLVFLCAGR
jgi:hypothetical protein